MNGSRPPNADLSTDTDLIRSYVESLISAGRTVTALMHSYGGQVGSNALTGLSVGERVKAGLEGGIASLVYMCAFAVPEGVSMIDKVREFGHESLIPVAFDFADDNSCVNRDPKALLLGPGLSDAESDEYLGSLVRWNGKAMYQSITNYAWKEDGIKISYIQTSGDMTVPLDYQKSMVDGMRAYGKEVETVELETGHCPNATMTKEVVDFITSFLDKLDARA